MLRQNDSSTYYSSHQNDLGSQHTASRNGSHSHTTEVQYTNTPLRRRSTHLHKFLHTTTQFRSFQVARTTQHSPHQSTPQAVPITLKMAPPIKIHSHPVCVYITRINSHPMNTLTRQPVPSPTPGMWRLQSPAGPASSCTAGRIWSPQEHPSSLSTLGQLSPSLHPTLRRQHT